MSKSTGRALRVLRKGVDAAIFANDATDRVQARHEQRQASSPQDPAEQSLMGEFLGKTRDAAITASDVAEESGLTAKVKQTVADVKARAAAALKS